MRWRYRELYWRLRRSVCLTFRRSCCEGRVKACIFIRFPSKIDHHGWRNVVIQVSTPKRVGGGGGLTVYISQCGGRGGISPTSTCNSCDSGRNLYCVTASLAATSARSIPRMSVWARILGSVVRNRRVRRSSRRSVILLNMSMWWR